jgi:hypothetical protein
VSPAGPLELSSPRGYQIAGALLPWSCEPNRRHKEREVSATAVSGLFKVECGELFPHGLGVVGEVTALDGFHTSSRENRVQARDKESELPLWSVEVLDFDPQARKKMLKVRSLRRYSRSRRRPWRALRFARWRWTVGARKAARDRSLVFDQRPAAKGREATRTRGSRIAARTAGGPS